MFAAVLATIVSIAISFAVLFANENMAAPDGKFRGGWMIWLSWLVTAWLWGSVFLS